MIYFIIGIFVAVISASIFGNMLMEGCISFLRYYVIRLVNKVKNKENPSDFAILRAKISVFLVNEMIGDWNHMTQEDKAKERHDIIGIIAVIIGWPIFVIAYLLSLKWHA